MRESRKAHRQNEREYDSCTPVKICLPREVCLILHGHVLSRSGHDPMSNPFQLSTLAGLLLTRHGVIGGHVMATSPMVHVTGSCLLGVFWPFQNTATVRVRAIITFITPQFIKTRGVTILLYLHDQIHILLLLLPDSMELIVLETQLIRVLEQALLTYMTIDSISVQQI